MPHMQWTPDLDTGIPVIDAQHQQIVKFINELDDAIRLGDAGQINLVSKKLLEYKIRHFEFEENLQEQAGYPFSKAHKKVHEVFLKRIGTFRDRAGKGENVAPELLTMLRLWMANHIKNDDRDYVESLRKLSAVPGREQAGLGGVLRKLFT